MNCLSLCRFLCMGLLLVGLVGDWPVCADEPTGNRSSEARIHVAPSANLPNFENRRAADEVVERKLLETRLDFKAEEMPIEEVFRWLSDQLEIPIDVDEAKLNPNRTYHVFPVTVDLQQVRAITLLRLLLNREFAVAMVHRGKVLITSPEVASKGKQMVTRYFDSRDFLGHDDPNFDVDEAVEVIVRSIDPESWEELGGSGVVGWFEDGVLVSQTWEIQSRVRSLVEAVRHISRLPSDQYDTTPRVAVEDPAEFAKTLRLIRETRILVEADELPLMDWITEVSGKSGIYFDPWPTQWGKETISGKWRDVTVEQLLDDVADDLKAAWTIDGNVVRFVESQPRRDTAASVVTKVYPVRDLLRKKTERNALLNPWTLRPSVDASSERFLVQGCLIPTRQLTLFYESKDDDLIELLTSTIDPESWEELGGPATIWSFRAGGCLVISQFVTNHDRIEQALADIRAKRGTRIPAADEDLDPLVIRGYYLIREAEAKPKQLAELSEWMQSLIEPDSWDEEGVSLRLFDERVIIRHRRSVQRQVRDFFEATGIASENSINDGVMHVPFAGALEEWPQ